MLDPGLRVDRKIAGGTQDQIAVRGQSQDVPHQSLRRVDVAGGRVRIDGRARVLDDAGKPIAQPPLTAEVHIFSLHAGRFTEDRVEGPISGLVRLNGTSERFAVLAELDPARLNVAGATLAISRLRIEGDQRELLLDPLRIDKIRLG